MLVSKYRLNFGQIMQAEPASILIVDDIRDNISLLSDYLKADYQVLAANNGEKALIIAEKLHPDLILLDIMMPVLNGYEVCEKLKENSTTADIPVIFLSALSTGDDESRGLSYGAVDYISKPFNLKVLCTRIQTQLKLRQAQKELHQYNKDLEKCVADRTAELSHANERLKKLDVTRQNFLALISHELRTPACGVLGLAELAYHSLEQYEDIGEHYNAFKDSSERLIQTIDNALLLTELLTNENFLEMETLEMAPLLNAALTHLTEKIGYAALDYEIITSSSDLLVDANRQLLVSSLTTLLQMAFMLSQKGSKLQLRSYKQDDTYVLQIRFSALPVSDSALSSYFDVFSTQRSNSYIENLGLSVPVAAQIIEAFDGSVSLQKTEGEIIEIVMRLNCA